MKMSSALTYCSSWTSQQRAADEDPQRVEALDRVQGLGPHVALAQRRHAEVDDRVGQCLAAKATER